MIKWRLFLNKVPARVIAGIISCGLICGCAGLAAQEGTTTKWHQYVTPRSPKNDLEAGVIQVAQTRNNMSVSGFDILFITTDASKQNSVQCVDVVDKANTGTAHSHDRTVVRYRVISGKISAMADPSTEYYRGADFERAILRAVAKTWSPDPVILYHDGSLAMTISSHAINDCTANVKIFEGDTMSAPVASKEVSFCFAR